MHVYGTVDIQYKYITEYFLVQIAALQEKLQKFNADVPT